MLYALAPIFLYSIYLYGWRPAVIAVIVFACGILTEFIVEKKRNKKVSEAVLVTCALFSLSLPPGIPLWMPPIGIVFAVLLGKEVYGGFGRNIFNPAITGRLFLYITFPTAMTSAWVNAGNWGMAADTVTSATPLETLRNGALPDLMGLIFGFRTGSIGEGAVFLIVLAAVYLMATKTASWRIIVSTLASAIVLQFVLFYAGVPKALPPLHGTLSGSLLFISVFMATDPVSAPKNTKSQWIFGILIGATTIIVRSFSLFAEGASFGILIGNTFASLIDEAFSKKKKGAQA